MAQPTILLVDDSGTVRTFVQKTLTAAGYRVVAACDGAAAIELAQQQCPDLAIIDVLMPGLDGYGVCEKLKQMGPPWSALPILFLTCVKSQALELLGEQYGAYLSKPVNSSHLLAAVEKQLSPLMR